MEAYVKSAKERGIELTPEQKAMIAEFEADDELLEQTGRVDFSKQKGAEAAEPAPAPPPPAAEPAPAPPPPTAAAPASPSAAAAEPESLPPAVVVGGAAAPRLWLMQMRDREA
eukprot:2798639-Prymnesium_polylepis.1